MSQTELDIQEQVVRIKRAIVESDKFAAEQRKLSEEAAKLAAEARKFDRERVLLFVTGAGGFIGAITGAVALWRTFTVGAN